MRMIRKYAATALMTALLMLLTVAGAQEPPAEYNVKFSYNDTEGMYIGEVYLDTTVHLSDGSFGIKYSPSLMGKVSFTLDTDNFQYANDPSDVNNPHPLEDGTNYIALSWYRPSALVGRWHLGTIRVDGVEMETNRNGESMPKDWHKETMYQLDWLSTNVSKSAWFTDNSQDVCLNDEIWRALGEGETAGEYIFGYYQGLDVSTDENNPTWVDIGYNLDFGGTLPDPPVEKTISGKVHSYNENNNVTVTLYNADGSTAKTAAAINKMTYSDGRVISEYTIDKVVTNTDDNPYYIIEMKKDAHLTYKEKITISADTVKNTQTLYCGDVTGDGKIKQNDRTRLLHALNTRALKYDLNGDGKVNLPDLNILKTYYNKTCESYKEVG